MADDQRRVMCGDRVIAGQWSGVVVSQRGQFSWVVIDHHLPSGASECLFCEAAQSSTIDSPNS